MKSQGLIQVFTGNGRGKTTAALGTAIRAVGACPERSRGGLKVAIVYFDKGGTHYSERAALASKFAGEIAVFATGLDRINPQTQKFRFGVTPEDKAEAARGLAIVRDLLSTHRHQLVVLDEINSTVSLGMLAEDDVLAVIRSKPEDVELILTGRDAPASFLELADLVVEMTLVKHYFYEGVKAREGIDY